MQPTQNGRDPFSSLPAWHGIVECPVPGRLPKPRQTGWTMLIDTGMSLGSMRSLLSIAADYVDLIKLSFGTSVLYTAETLRAKVLLGRQYGVEVYPGGTLLEIAMIQDRLEPFAERAAEIGFKYLEISDGTVSMNPRFRERLIKQLVAMGFCVISEVGKKHPADRLPHLRVREQINEDLAAGSSKVIIEGRESGKGVVIYRNDGSIDEDELEFLAQSVPDPNLLLWEAPQKPQQQDLIMRFGTNVNLGNVYPEHAIALEALRVGLRGDTLRSVLLSRPQLASVRPSWPPLASMGG